MDVATVQITIPLKRIQESMAGEAERAGFASPDDVENYIKSRRKNMKNSNYVALMEHDRRTGKYGVVVPDIPGFSTVGDSYDAAVKNAVEGLTGHIEVMEKYGETVAPPRTIEEIRAQWPEWEEWREETGGDIVATIAVVMRTVLQVK